MPANWVCWAIISISSDKTTDDYIVRRGMFSTDPVLFPVDKCPRLRINDQINLQNHNPELQWDVEFRAKISELKNIHKNCTGSAFLKFSRVPIWQKLETNNLRLDDLRFMRDNKPTFSTVIIQEKCPNFIPNWRAPRLDLLN